MVALLMVALCVVGIIGAVATAVSYDQPGGQMGGPMRIPKRSRRQRRERRRSRQLQALEAALGQDPPTGPPESCSDGARRRGRWLPRRR